MNEPKYIVTVSFDKPACNYERGDSEKIKAWNRRVSDERIDL